MKRNRISLKRAAGIIILSLSGFLFLGCFEGYVGSEGAPLSAYLYAPNLKDLTENPDDNIWIIDVRPTAQYTLGHIPTALSYPSTEIDARLDELPLDQYLIVYCESGIRAQAVIKKLEGYGYTHLMNWGSVLRWRWDLETGS